MTPVTVVPEDLGSKRRLLALTRSLLREYGVRPSRRRGQNFTVSPSYITSFSRALSRAHARLGGQSGPVLEIGTGLGVLTLAATRGLGEGVTIVTVELDRRLFEASSHAVGYVEDIVFVKADGLEVARGACMPLLFSNTPFSITSPLMVELARNNCLKEAVLGVQREVADRLTARPGSDDYGRLSVLAQLFFRVERITSHPPGDFWPPPEVSVSIVTLSRTKPYEPSVHGFMEELTACIFSQRNRLAEKVVERCLRGLGAGDCVGYAKGLISSGTRVRSLDPGIVEEIAGRGARCRG